MSIYHHQPYQPVSNGRPTKLGDIENLRLLSVSDSDVEAEPELKQRGGSPKISKNVPDLKLTMPSGSIGANRVLSTAGKIRKKIRLKRKQRDRLSNGVHHQNTVLSTTSETGGSDVEDEPCNAMDVCLACVPSSVLRSPCCYSRPSTSNRAAQRHLWLHAFILFLFAVALAGLAYYTMTLQTQLAILRVNLEPVLEDKTGLETNQNNLQTRLSLLANNQSILTDNLTRIISQVEQLSAQMQTLNSSVKSVLTSLENAPQLKNVPTDISNLREEFGQIGSRLTDVEHGIKNMDSLVKTMPEISSKKVAIDDKDLQGIRDDLEGRVLNETSKLEKKIDSASNKLKVVGTNLTEQLQKLEMRDQDNWKLLEQLNNDVQNISAKASSNKLINGQNLDEINKLKQEITQMKIHQTTGSISNNSPDLNTTSSTKTTLITP